MKYHLDTIPVWDALKQGGECFLCNLEKKTEQLYTENYLGGAAMSPEVRERINEVGFCHRHFSTLYAQRNRLPLALISHTYMRETSRGLAKQYKKLPSPSKIKESAFSKKSSADGAMDDFLDFLSKKEHSCLICDDLARTMDRYIYTAIYLTRTSSEFRGLMDNSQGLCLHHIRRSAEIAKDAFGAKGCAEWLNVVLPPTFRAFERLDGEIEWFTKKFDYRYREEPWGTSEDALVRVIAKLSGNNDLK